MSCHSRALGFYLFIYLFIRKSLVSDGFRVDKEHFLISPPWLAFENWQLFYPVTLKLLRCGENLVWQVWLQPDPPCWAKMFKNKQKNYFFKTPVATMCNFSSAKPANIIAMFDTIFKTSPVKCYSFKQSQVFPFQFRRLHQGWSSLPMLLRAPRACLASVLPQTVLLTIFLIWSPLDQLASALVISTTWSLSTSATHARATATIG